MRIDFSKISNIEFDSVDTSDYPDFCDAYICAAWYDGESASDEILAIINDDSGFVYDALINYLL